MDIWFRLVFGSGSAGFDQTLRYFTDRNGPKGGLHENEFWAFSNSEMNVTNREKKVDEKNRVSYLVSMFPSYIMVLKLPKKVHFMQLCADLSKKSNSIKAVYIYASEGSHYALSEMVLFIMLWLTVSEIGFEVKEFC